MNGLELSERLYRDTVRAAIEAEFPEAAPRIAVGLAGPGSECFGYDDEISRDHDFAPRLCLWLTEEDAKAFGALLQSRYEAWTSGFAPVTAAARDRSGVIAIPDFYRRFTGCPGVPPDAFSWLRVPEHLLAAATNGKVFRDDLGDFSAVRAALLAGYPPDVRRKRLAARLFTMGQAGQYNLPRCIRRGDAVAARFAETEFMTAALQAVCLLGGRYAPYYKWLWRAASELPLLSGAVEGVASLPACPDAEKTARVEEICVLVADELRRQWLSQEADDFLVNQAFAVQGGIEDTRLRALDVGVG